MHICKATLVQSVPVTEKRTMKEINIALGLSGAAADNFGKLGG
jgi:hypothetical protein